jgi:D-alanine-D-alanine ligase
MRVGITYNVRSSQTSSEESDDVPLDEQAEWDEPETVQFIIDTLAKYHDVIPIEANEDAFEKLRRSRPELVFNIAEGRFGASRESQVPAILEMLGIPYTGSDPLVLGICLDKSRAKEILAYRRIPTAKFSVLRSWPLNGQLRHVDYPMFVKPLFEGSSKGIWNDALVKNFSELKASVEKVWSTYSQPALVEEYLPGREFTVALLGNGDRLRALPIVEIAFDVLPEGANKFYSYEAKWLWDLPDNPLEIYHCPAPIDDTLRLKIETVCKKAFHTLGCRDWCRIDVRLDAAGEPCILELNPLPGIIPDPKINSCFPKAARAAGMSYDDLLLSVMNAACERVGLRS